MGSKYNVFEGKPISHARNAGSECTHVEATLDYGITAPYRDLGKPASSYLKSPLQTSVSSFFS